MTDVSARMSHRAIPTRPDCLFRYKLIESETVDSCNNSSVNSQVERIVNSQNNRITDSESWHLSEVERTNTSHEVWSS